MFILLNDLEGLADIACRGDNASLYVTTVRHYFPNFPHEVAKLRNLCFLFDFHRKQILSISAVAVILCVFREE